MTADAADSKNRMRATSRSLPIALLRARDRVMGPIRAMLADAGVTEQQWRVLRVLAEQGPADATEIARQACLLMPSLTRIIQGLEKRAYCTRSPHPTDRRRFVIEITGTGRELIERNIPQSTRIFAELEAEFGKERIEALLDMLNDLSAAK
ncbi:MAG: homoprotocatechuate degradation operon regulator HpaR [Rhodobacteraceae bacterium]|nr:homoprotocatechuate degradation operon regulator HpaR [Paracoccaceae bacterium]